MQTFCIIFNKTIPNGPILEVSVQKTTGSFHMNWLHAPVTSIFSNLSNIVIRLRPRHVPVKHTSDSLKFVPNDSTERSSFAHYLEYILTSTKNDLVRSNINKGYHERHQEYLKQNRTGIMFSAHFDTALHSKVCKIVILNSNNCQGASDDTVHIGVLLELAQVYANQQQLEIPLIFVLNGGEEPGLQVRKIVIYNHFRLRMASSHNILGYKMQDLQSIWKPQRVPLVASCFSKLHPVIPGLSMLTKRAMHIHTAVSLRKTCL